MLCRLHTLFGNVRQQISHMLVVDKGEQSSALQPTAPFSEPLLVRVALPRDEFNDAYEDDDDDFELR